MKRKLIIAFITLQLSAADLIAQKNMDIQKWVADIDYMSANMKKFHKNLFHTLKESSFDSSVDRLKADVPHLRDHEIIVRIAQIEASINDGHTQFNFLKNNGLNFHSFPIRIYEFSDGVFIRASDEAHKKLIGAKIIAIGKTPISDAAAKINSVIGSDNWWGKTYFRSYYLDIIEILDALKITKGLDSCLFTLEREGRQFDVWLKPSYVQESLKGDMDTYWINPQGWFDARNEEQTPLWLKIKKGEKYSFKYLKDKRIIYVQVNEINDSDNGETITEFYQRMFKFSDSVPVNKLILDLRHNGGGNAYFNKPLVIGLLKSKFDEKGKLFVLTGRRTFSAAQMLVTQLRSLTQAVMIGEPTASKANHYGDSRKIVLPNSGIIVRASTLWHQLGSATDESLITGPDLYIPLTFSDYRSNRDPVFEEAVNYIKEPTLAERLESYSTPFDSAKLVNDYRLYKEDPRHQFVNTKVALRDIGSILYNKGNYSAAALIFSLNAKEYPEIKEFALAGLAYEKINKMLAAQYYRKALALDPSDEELPKILKGLEGR